MEKEVVDSHGSNGLPSKGFGLLGEEEVEDIQVLGKLASNGHRQPRRRLIREGGEAGPGEEEGSPRWTSSCST